MPNHNIVFAESRSELFKWASDDDLYAGTCFERCVDALDEHPDVVLAHSWTGDHRRDDKVVRADEYPLATALAANRRRASAACCSTTAVTTTTG